MHFSRNGDAITCCYHNVVRFLIFFYLKRLAFKNETMICTTWLFVWNQNDTLLSLCYSMYIYIYICTYMYIYTIAVLEKQMLNTSSQRLWFLMVWAHCWNIMPSLLSLNLSYGVKSSMPSYFDIATSLN